MIFVTKFDPFTSSSGGASRTRAVLGAYAARGAVPSRLVALERFSRDRLRSDVPVERHRQDAWDLLLGLARSRSATTARYYSRRLASALADLPDDVPLHVDYSHMLVNVPARSRARAVVDCHNVESELVAQAAQQARPGWRRALLALEAHLLRAFERRALGRARVLLCCSAEDRERLAAWARDVRVFRNGAERMAVAKRPETRALFVGTVAWGPNRRGLVWFLREVWPLVVRQLPGAALDVVGADPSADVRAAAASTSGVVLHGFVPSLEPLYETAAVSVAPLLEGSGSRLKILESVAAATPVVSTPRGAEGIDADGVTVVEGAEPFASAVVAALREPVVLSPDVVTSVSWDRDAPVFDDLAAPRARGGDEPDEPDRPD
ncbi:glycosyltransferase [Quadrisphaera sp. DSM 44207]|uniref:glycosyltransferase n=1 Tax=Quadrisphaera sp. DSM 44207 TaxID=1881057 RepID=UPI000887D9A1|nr:glycosyltransferase [Quadrisphaera sp. DSM 44207]SDQ66821.1 Glycosyltransferase involved in cell wall bisynthesis [Quadrisphaera sp. DSM 44207]